MVACTARVTLNFSRIENRLMMADHSQRLIVLLSVMGSSNYVQSFIGNKTLNQLEYRW